MFLFVVSVDGPYLQILEQPKQVNAETNRFLFSAGGDGIRTVRNRMSDLFWLLVEFVDIRLKNFTRVRKGFCFVKVPHFIVTMIGQRKTK